MRIRLTLIGFTVLTATLCLAALLSLARAPADAAALPITPTPLPDPDLHCGVLGVVVDNHPIFDGSRFCPEFLLQELPRTAIAAITSIAYAPPCDQLDEPRDWCGALFFVRPDVGALQWVGAYHRDTRTYEINTFATGLTTPNGLAWHDGAWYVAGGSNVYRLADDDGDNVADDLAMIIDDLPDGGGHWPGSVGFGPDGRLYVSQGSSCNACEENGPRQAAILSFAPDGSDGQIVASGLRDAFDFAWHPASGLLWVTESGRDGLGENAPLDELNRIDGTGQHFGWPYCYHTTGGLTVDETVPNASLDFCRGTVEPAVTLAAHSHPAGLTFYTGAAFPELNGDLLVVASGSWNRRVPSGYTLLRVCFDPAGNTETCLDTSGSPILDSQGHPTNQRVLVPFDPYYGYNLEELHIQGQSFYPDHPVDIAISPQGWIALSVMEGRLIQIRPVGG